MKEAEKPQAKEELELALAEAEMKYQLLKNNVDFADQMQKRLALSLGYATKEVEADPSYTMQERKMKQNVVYNQYFKVCYAIITLCKSF